MAELDLEEAERAVRLELARVIERGIKADIAEYAVREALPHILEALRADAEETGWPGAEEYLAGMIEEYS